MESKKRFTSSWGQAAQGSIGNEAKRWKSRGRAVLRHRSQRRNAVGVEELVGIEVMLIVKCTLFLEEFSSRGKGEKKWDGDLRSSQVERVFA